MAASATQASSLARTRLTKERKEWRKEHPPGFYARPERKADGSTDILSWTAGIPGKAGVRHSEARLHCLPMQRRALTPLSTDALGGRRLQAFHAVSTRLPVQATKVYVCRRGLRRQSFRPKRCLPVAAQSCRSVHATALPPKCVP